MKVLNRRAPITFSSLLTPSAPRVTATFAQGCQRTIYLLDDGKDPKKRKWVDSLGADVVYVSGRKRPPGEMNGKSGNLNNVCAQLYPKGMVIPGNELVAVFDADQVRLLVAHGCGRSLLPVRQEEHGSKYFEILNILLLVCGRKPVNLRSDSRVSMSIA